MATKKNEWVVEEVHGIWWAYVKPRPSNDKFVTHNRPYHPLIMGPFYSKEFAEKKVSQAS